MLIMWGKLTRKEGSTEEMPDAINGGVNPAVYYTSLTLRQVLEIGN